MKHEINAIDLEVHFQVNEPGWLLLLHLDTAIRSYLKLTSEDWIIEIHPGPRDEEDNCTMFTMRICPRCRREDLVLHLDQRNKLFDVIFGSFICTKVDGLAHTYQRERGHGEEPLQLSYDFMSLEEYHWTLDEVIAGQPFIMRIWRLPECVLDKLDSRWENSYMASECSYMLLACGQMAHLEYSDEPILPYIPKWVVTAKQEHKKGSDIKQQDDPLMNDVLDSVRSLVSKFNHVIQALGTELQNVDHKIEEAGKRAADSGKESK